MKDLKQTIISMKSEKSPGAPSDGTGAFNAYLKRSIFLEAKAKETLCSECSGKCSKNCCTMRTTECTSQFLMSEMPVKYLGLTLDSNFALNPLMANVGEPPVESVLL